MILEESIIDSARIIRNEFIKLNQSLASYEGEITGLGKSFISISEELDALEVSKEETLFDIRDKVLEKLTTLEIESGRVTKKIDDLNNKIEKLKKEEVSLYELIKKRYPKLSDEEIKIDIQKRI